MDGSGAMGDGRQENKGDSKAHANAFGGGSRVFRFAEMPARRNANGSESRDVGSGALATGERVRVHESVQAAGLPLNPEHSIAHTEFICVREGVLEFAHDGMTDRAQAGDIIFVAKGTMHRVRNAGEGPASYFVVSIGGDV